MLFEGRSSLMSNSLNMKEMNSLEKTEGIQRRANWELERMDSLDLSEEQEDQIFGILVQKSSQFDEAMEIEGISAELPEAARSDDVSKEDAIRSILNPDQLEKYNERVEKGGLEEVEDEDLGKRLWKII